jgi:hypothetical protein
MARLGEISRKDFRFAETLIHSQLSNMAIGVGG